MWEGEEEEEEEGQAWMPGLVPASPPHPQPLQDLCLALGVATSAKRREKLRRGRVCRQNISCSKKRGAKCQLPPAPNVLLF